MKKSGYILFAFLFAVISSDVKAQDAKFPIVKGFGGIYEIPGSINPDTGIDYKLVIDLKTGQDHKEQMNAGLNNTARMINLHGLGGVKNKNMDVVVVAHGGATEAIMNNEAYRMKNGVDNPNLELINALKDSGIELYVCGQSLLARGFDADKVNDQVLIGLSMLTVVTEYMHNGYQLLVFD